MQRTEDFRNIDISTDAGNKLISALTTGDTVALDRMFTAGSYHAALTQAEEVLLHDLNDPTNDWSQTKYACAARANAASYDLNRNAGDFCINVCDVDGNVQFRNLNSSEYLALQMGLHEVLARPLRRLVRRSKPEPGENSIRGRIREALHTLVSMSVGTMNDTHLQDLLDLGNNINSIPGYVVPETFEEVVVGKDPFRSKKQSPVVVTSS